MNFIDKWQDLLGHVSAGKIMFYPDGKVGRFRKENCPGGIFFRDDPYTIEVYGSSDEDYIQIYPTLEQLEMLRDFLILECQVHREFIEKGIID